MYALKNYMKYVHYTRVCVQKRRHVEYIICENMIQKKKNDNNKSENAILNNVLFELKTM